MRHRRNFRTRNIELFDAEQLVLFRAHGDAARRLDAVHQQHIRAVAIELEPIGNILAQHRGRKRPEGLAVFDLEVEHRLHGRRARVTKDGAPAKRARAELHSPLEPAQRAAPGKITGTSGKQSLVSERVKHRTRGLEPRFDIGLRKLRPKIAPAHAVAPVRRGARPVKKTVKSRKRRTQGAAGIAGRRLDPDVLETLVTQQLAVGDTVERHPAGETEIFQPGLFGRRTRKLEHHLLGHLLHRSGEIHMLLRQ